MVKRLLLAVLGCVLVGTLGFYAWISISGQRPLFYERSAEQAEKARQLVTRQKGSDKQVSQCRNWQQYRQPLFGDLHVHTAFSQDASTQGTRNTPFDAYRYARGERLDIQPYDENGNALRSHQLKRPLDFAAVTDHAEQFGEVKTCSDPELPGFNSVVCKLYRSAPRAAYFVMNTQANSGLFEGRFGFCGDNGEDCLAAAKTVWQEIQLAAAHAQDYSENCEFTSFVAYEWTGAFEVANLHRNVIFRSAKVPELPVSFYEAKTSGELWRQLDEVCEPGDDCEYIVIPHNSNLSDGFMFPAIEDKTWTADLAKRHREKEPLMEIMQHKGASECYFGPLNTLAQDEYCEFEQLPYSRFSGKYLASMAEPVKPSAGYLREVLREGIRIEKQTGENPYMTGVIASSDTHLATPGYVEEENFMGHGGAGVPAEATETKRLPDDVEFNPGGLAVVWAEENSRESIFSALKRRETYGTSGPRIVLRSFVAEQFPEGICQQPDWLETAYQQGKPMGASFTVAPGVAAPQFLVSAQKDALGEVELQQLQMVKVWVDAQGNSQERVYTIAGSPDNGAGVNLDTCEPYGEGHANLCTVWQDPEFNNSVAAAYYVRALENPVCRWHTRVCRDLAVDCSDPGTLDESLQACCQNEYPKTIQERAWSSPNWYKPLAE